MYSVARSLLTDIQSLHRLMEGDSFIYRKRFGEDLNLHYLIETGFLSITARDVSSGEIVGFASFTDAPAAHVQIEPSRWEETVGQLDVPAGKRLTPCSTLWMSCYVGPEGAVGFEVLVKILTTALTTVPRVSNVLFPLPTEAPPFSPVSDVFVAIPQRQSAPVEFAASILHIAREDLIPPLKLRAGVVEDYDDLMPLVLSGEGLVTPLPPNLYLEELLQDQDEHKAVVVATDPATNEVVGLMCLKAENSDLQHYVIGDYAELKALVSRSHGKHRQGPQTQGSLVHITFLYLKPQYDSRAPQLLPHAFHVFPQAEYVYIKLPHAQPEHPVLYNFTYVPIKEFKPSGGQGDRPSLEGLWIVSRSALDDVTVAPIAQSHETAATKLISSSELPQDASEAMCLALSQSIPIGTARQGSQPPPFGSFVMMWGENVVGAAVIRHVSVEEMYSLRENFDLDEFVNFVPSGDPHVGQTDISVDATIAQSTFYRNDMPGVIIKHAYLKPIFRCRMRFLLSEVLRLSGAEVVINLAGPATQTYTTLLAELVLTPPRRMIDQPLERSDEDVDSLVCLHHTTRKSLSDEKTKIHARIVVIGAGTTGLAFIYSLIKIPYLHFDNILLVSRDGLPNHPLHRESLWTVDTMDWLEREYIFLQVGKKIRVIEDTMTAFERHEFYITLESSHHKNEPYDYLIITAGRQYALPKELSATHGSKNGVFALSHEKYIDRIKQHIHESEIYEDDRSNAVIYGCGLDVFCVATAIMDLNLAPQRIAIVMPYDPSIQPKQRSYEEDEDTDEFGPPFNDPLVELKVEALLESLGVKLYKGYELRGNASCMDEDGDKNLTTVVISPMGRSHDGKDIEINATMFIYAHEKDIDTQLLSALNKQSIVFDGRVIIENSYRTTNPQIFAAGPVAMFSRRFGGSRNFDNFSALEVGRHLCHTVLGFLGIDEFVNKDLQSDDKDVVLRDDPLAAQIGTSKKDVVNASAAEVAKRRPKPLPQYVDNVCRRVVLPAGYQYFTCYSMNYEFISERCTQLTSSSPSGTCYLALNIGPNKYIESVVYFGNEPVELYNLRSLVGMPESALNLLYNYNERRNPQHEPTLDLLQYFRSPWAYAVFYDRFQQLYSGIRTALNDHPDVKRIKQDILQVALKEGTDTISDDERYTYHRRLTHDASDARHVVELELLRYLHANKAFIPQRYFLPDIAPFQENRSKPP